VTSIHRIVADLKTSFEVGGIEAMSQTHSAAMQSNRSYRLLYWLVNLVYPAAPLLDIAENLDRCLGERGIADGSKAILNSLPIQRRTELPQRGEDEMKTGPIVVFGKHGSLLTPLLVASSLDRHDLKMLSVSYIAKLGPNVARSIYPVLTPQSTFRDAGRVGVIPRISGWLTSRLESPVEKSIARERNRASLIQAAKHVQDGGALLIAPDARDPKAEWRQGIGHLIAHLAQIEATDNSIYLVPYRIWAPITGVFRLLSRNPILRALGKRQYRQPIRVVFGEPILLADVIKQANLNPSAITKYLQTHYAGLGF